MGPNQTCVTLFELLTVNTTNVNRARGSPEADMSMRYRHGNFKETRCMLYQTLSVNSRTVSIAQQSYISVMICSCLNAWNRSMSSSVSFFFSHLDNQYENVRTSAVR